LENKHVTGERSQDPQDPPSVSASREPKQLLKAGFLMLTSAVLGGVAFAIWNKRQIASMKESSAGVQEKHPAVADDDAIY
jgi:hypothetical protein